MPVSGCWSLVAAAVVVEEGSDGVETEGAFKVSYSVVVSFFVFFSLGFKRGVGSGLAGAYYRTISISLVH